MTQSGNMIGAQPSVWTVGSLSADELERLAGEIRPAWEIGLDAVNDGASAVVAAAIVPSSSGFAAAPATLASALGSMSGGTQSASVNAAIATAVPQAGVPPRTAPSVPPARVVPPSNAFASQPVQANARPWEDAAAPASKPKGLLFGGIAAGIAAVGLIAFFALRGGESATPSTAAAPESPHGSVSPESASNVAPPAAAPASASAHAVAPHIAAATPTHAAPSAQAPMVAEPPAVAPSLHHGRHVAAAPPPPPPVVARPTVAAAPARHHHAATASHGARRMRGAGFVTDSPY